MGETVGFSHDHDEVAVDGEDGADFRAAGFECVAGPDVANTREVVGLRRFEKDAAAPTGCADDVGFAVFLGDGAVVEERGDVGAAFTGDGFHPDVLVGGYFGDFPVDRDAFHDGGRG